METKAALKDYIGANCLSFGEYTLSSGRKSDKYFNLKPALLNGQALTWIVELMANLVQDLPLDPKVIGGKATGANYLTPALVRYAHEQKLSYVHGSIAYEELKSVRMRVYNPPQPGELIAVVDDVFTTMGSAGFAEKAFAQYYGVTVGFLGIIDRRGLVDIKNTRGLIVRTIFREDDF